jgi:putative ABC transport system permease protein
VKLAPGADISSVSEAVKKVKVHSEDTEYRITKLHSHWFMWDRDIFGDKTGGNKLMCYILLVIAILFLAIAAFNYINFAMASIPFRIKDINTRKVYGASRQSLILRQLLLAFGIVGAAFLFGVLTMRTLSGTSWATFLSGSMAPGKNITVILIGGAVAVVVALVSGLVPAYYSTSFQPALVLKGAFSMTAKGGGLRTVTLILQYVLSFIFIISALVLQRQTNFMAKNNDLGFDYDLVLKMDSKLYSPIKEVADEIRKIPGVIDVTRGESPIQDNPSSRSEIRDEDNDNVVQFSFRDVPPEYPEFFHLELVEGRMPLPGENGVALVNESFVEALPSYGVGKTINRFNKEATIIGVLKDFHARTFQHTYSPLALFVTDTGNYNSFMIRVQKDADVSGILAKSSEIYRSIRNLDESDIATGFLNKDIEKLYEQEIRQTRLIKMSSLLSLLIALIGILGLVWFDTRYMRKEVAIRKVNGASSKDILTKINLKYILIAGVSFVIATPLAYAIAQRWMSQFAFRTNIPAWLFAVAFVVVLLITLAVVTLQSWNTANANPVDSLKNE